MAPRLKERYDAQVREALRQELGLSNVMEVPRLTKIVINMGVGRATQQGSLLDGAVTDLTLISGQKPLVTKATKSIAEAETVVWQTTELTQAIGFDLALPGDVGNELGKQTVDQALQVFPGGAREPGFGKTVRCALVLMALSALDPDADLV